MRLVKLKHVKMKGKKHVLSRKSKINKSESERKVTFESEG